MDLERQSANDSAFDGRAPTVASSVDAGTAQADTPSGAQHDGEERGRQKQGHGRIVLRLVNGLRDADSAEIEAATVRLSGTRRWLVPLGYVAGTLALVVDGVKPLIANWRLTVIELIPAAWIWFSIWNLRSHVLDGLGVDAWHGWVLIPAAAAIFAAAIAAFFCNTVFAFAIGSEPPRIRPAVAQARAHLRTVLLWGMTFGTAQSIVDLWVPHFGEFWYEVALSVLLVAMMISFVAVPAAIIGHRQKRTTKDKVGVTAVAATLSAVAATPGFIFDRLGLLMLGIRDLRVLGVVFLSIGVALQVAGTSSVKAVKLSAHLTSSGRHRPDDPGHECEAVGDLGR